MRGDQRRLSWNLYSILLRDTPQYSQSLHEHDIDDRRTMVPLATRSSCTCRRLQKNYAESDIHDVLGMMCDDFSPTQPTAAMRSKSKVSAKMRAKLMLKFHNFIMLRSKFGFKEFHKRRGVRTQSCKIFTEAHL